LETCGAEKAWKNTRMSELYGALYSHFLGNSLELGCEKSLIY